jgi:hypothetical protein
MAMSKVCRRRRIYVDGNAMDDRSGPDAAKVVKRPDFAAFLSGVYAQSEAIIY